MRELPLGIRLETAERAALDRAAIADQRPLSALGRRIITDWLMQNGWLETRPGPALPIAANPARENHPNGANGA